MSTRSNTVAGFVSTRAQTVSRERSVTKYYGPCGSGRFPTNCCHHSFPIIVVPCRLAICLPNRKADLVAAADPRRPPSRPDPIPFPPKLVSSHCPPPGGCVDKHRGGSLDAWQCAGAPEVGATASHILGADPRCASLSFIKRRGSSGGAVINNRFARGVRGPPQFGLTTRQERFMSTCLAPRQVSL